MTETILQKLRRAFPKDTDAILVRGIREGVMLADEATRTLPFLKGPVGQDMRGFMRRAAIIHSLHGLCLKGELAFQASISPMPHGHWHWLEFRSENVRGHICRSDGEEMFPVDAQSRQDARLTNQLDLFSDPKVVDFREILGTVDTLYAWLTYGMTKAGDLTHVCWGVPAADQNEWLARVNILSSAAVAGEENQASSSTIEPKVVLKFKEDIQEALKNEKRDQDKTED